MKLKDKTARTDKLLGARVRARRHAISMSQEKLGDALGLTFQQVQKYENGSNRIGAGTLYELARILGVKPSWFFEDLETLPGPANDSLLMDFAQTSDGVAIVALWPRLKDDCRRSLAGVARHMTDL